jgi:hypothetical protein
LPGDKSHLAKVGVEGSNPFARSNNIIVRPGDMGDRTYLRHG